MKIFEVESAEQIHVKNVICKIDSALRHFNRSQDYYVLKNQDKIDIVFKDKSEPLDWTYCPAGSFKLVYETDDTDGQSVLTIKSTDDKAQRARVDRLYSDQYMITESGVAIYIKDKNVCDTITNKAGYIYLYNKSNKWIAIHRMVAACFCEVPEPLKHIKFKNLMCNHKDGIKHNNHYTNLEWVTSKQNCQHAFNTNLNSRSGENHSNSKFTNDEIKNIRKGFYESGKNIPTYASNIGLSTAGLSKLLKNTSRHDPDYEPDFDYLETIGQQKGEQSGNAKLKQHQVDWLRKDYIEYHKPRSYYAKELNVSEVLIKKIVRNKSWYDPNYDPNALSSSKNDSVRSEKDIENLEKGNLAFYKLTKDDVEWIRKDYKQNQNPYSYYARKYNVSKDNIRAIVTNRSWFDPEYKPSVGILQKKLLTYENACWIRQHKRDNPDTPQKFYMDTFNIPQNLVSFIIANKSYIDKNWHVY